MTRFIREGDIIARKYRIEKVLGEGGMGVVVSARHVHLDEPVAIKLLHPEKAMDAVVVQRFLREARAAAKIKSENVVRVSDVDILDSGEPYMVMEHLDGRDLAGVCAIEGRLDPRRAVDYVLQTCTAIEQAHARGIIHRDLKPSNLFVVRGVDGTHCVKVLDFGISKLKDNGGAPDGNITSTATIMGSPHFMSPEQMCSTRDVDERTDIWALGATLYQLVTGHLPFQGETMAAVCGLVLFKEPRRPRELRADLSVGLESIILRCLEKDPSQRFATVTALRAALEPHGSMGAEASTAPGREATSPTEVIPPRASTLQTDRNAPVVQALRAPATAVLPPLPAVKTLALEGATPTQTLQAGGYSATRGAPSRWGSVAAENAENADPHSISGRTSSPRAHLQRMKVVGGLLGALAVAGSILLLASARKDPVDAVPASATSPSSSALAAGDPVDALSALPSADTVGAAPSTVPDDTASLSKKSRRPTAAAGARPPPTSQQSTPPKQPAAPPSGNPFTGR